MEVSLPVHFLNLKIKILFLSLGVWAVDQAAKILALHFLSGIPTLAVLPGIFHLTLIHNSGVAFGLFRGWGLFVTVVTLGILIGLIAPTFRRDPSGREPSWVPLGLILGGASGNLTDRLLRGGVVDFLDFRIWPVFNLADSCITVGAVWMAWALLRSR